MATRQSPRESIRRASRASTTRQSSPRSRAYNHYTDPPAQRGRRARSPSYHVPGSDEHISQATNLVSETRDRRARSPESDECIGEVLKNDCESFRIRNYETQSGTYHCNVIFNPRLVPSRFRENLTPAQQNLFQESKTYSFLTGEFREIRKSKSSTVQVQWVYPLLASKSARGG